MEPSTDIRIVLVRPRQPENIGTAARALASHGLTDLVLVNPQGFDPDRARRMAPNAHHIIDDSQIVGSVSAAIADAITVVGTSAKERRWPWQHIHPKQLPELIDRGPACILFGPEDTGLTTHDLQHVDHLLTIPTVEHRSLNLGQSVTLICAALTALRPKQHASGPSPIDSARKAMLTESLMEILMQVGYLKGQSNRNVHTTLYQLISRFGATDQEAIAALGMIKKIRRRLDNTNEELVP